MILTRFSRVTFSAAHKYLGLTTEVLRTEKAINEIACHPLPTSFYEGGGLQYLRQRFDDVMIQGTDSESDYFSQATTSSAASVSKLGANSDTSEKLPESPMTMRAINHRSTASRHQVQAGDLHTSSGQGHNDNFKSLNRVYSFLSTPRLAALKDPAFKGFLPGEEFDLREEVMSCVAKSIGFLQPPVSGGDSTEDSPGLPPLDPVRPSGTLFASPLGPLSLFDSGDDSTSSVTGASSSNATSYMSGLDNEVEILFFSAGSTLVKAGERNTGLKIIFTTSLPLPLMNLAVYHVGLYYVIEGFLDILLPLDVPTTSAPHPRPTSDTDSVLTYDQRQEITSQDMRKLLFTVKPGGIAGYLGT